MSYRLLVRAGGILFKCLIGGCISQRRTDEASWPRGWTCSSNTVGSFKKRTESGRRCGVIFLFKTFLFLSSSFPYSATWLLTVWFVLWSLEQKQVAGAVRLHLISLWTFTIPFKKTIKSEHIFKIQCSKIVSENLNYLTLSLFSFSGTGSEEKPPQTSLTHHAASSRANPSQPLEVTDNDDEPIGDRWDEDEDWGSLEVGCYYFWRLSEMVSLHSFNFEVRKWLPGSHIGAS